MKIASAIVAFYWARDVRDAGSGNTRSIRPEHSPRIADYELKTKGNRQWLLVSFEARAAFRRNIGVSTSGSLVVKKRCRERGLRDAGKQQG